MLSRHILVLLAALVVGGVAPVAALAGDGEVTFIHIGDLHGHLIQRPNMREGDPDHGQMVGGLAYVRDQIEKIRGQHPDATMLVNTGDTIQGSAEALYSRGSAMTDILNDWGIDAFAAGNWDFLYGSRRFIELFAGETAEANWNLLAANLYYATLYEFPETPYASKAGTRVVPPYMIKEINGVKIGMIGLTADRGPQAVSPMVMAGFYLTPGEEELEEAIPKLRNEHKVDLVVLISERGLAANLELVETYPGVDIVLSSDMHEETHKVVIAKSGTILVEEGQDGTMVGELTATVKNGKMVDYKFKAHRVNETSNKAHPETLAAVNRIRSTFVKGSEFVPHVNPINSSVLRTPVDTVIGFTKTALHRSAFSDTEKPAVLEGTSHNFLADAFKGACDSEIGLVRGFRYGTHIAPAQGFQLADFLDR